MKETPQKNRLLRRWEWYLLAAVALILLYFLLESLGIGPVEVTEDSQIIQRPHD